MHINGLTYSLIVNHGSYLQLRLTATAHYLWCILFTAFQRNSSDNMRISENCSYLSRTTRQYPLRKSLSMAVCESMSLFTMGCYRRFYKYIIHIHNCYIHKLLTASLLWLTSTPLLSVTKHPLPWKGHSGSVVHCCSLLARNNSLLIPCSWWHLSVKVSHDF